jgi:hypothetical protein
VNLVTNQEAYDQLRLDDTAHDRWLAVWIPAVSQAVLNWLKDEWRAFDPMLGPDGQPVLDSAGDPIPEIDSNGEMIPKWSVKAAVLLELASQFRFRDGSGTDNVVPADAGHGYVLNKASTALLAPLRKTTVR